MSAFATRVTAHDKSLMLANISILLEMQIPQLWLDGKFTATSQHYIWMYLDNLCRFATSSADPRPDISPPTHLPSNAMPGIQKIYDELPKNMLDKVKNIAEKYTADIETGKTSIGDLKFDDISKELFSQIDPEEMQQMITSVGAMLQGGDGGGGMGDLFKMFSQQNTEEVD
jgi:hypothetical protein